MIVHCDLAKGCWMQSCLDPDCRSEDYRSKVRSAPLFRASPPAPAC